MNEIPCIEVNCYAISEPGTSRCVKHRRTNAYQSRRNERLPKDWLRRREQVFRRDGRICYLCGGGGADTIDHIVRGDDHSLENLAPVHDNIAPHCHRSKTAGEGNEAKKMNQAMPWAKRWEEEMMKRRGLNPF